MTDTTTDRRITLERIESYLPERSVRIEELGERLGLHRAQLGVFRKFYGLDRLRYDPELPLLDLLRPAARCALAALPEGGRVDYLAYAHVTQAVAPADVDVARLVGDDLGLADTEAFGLSHQACVSSLGAIEVLGELLRAEGGEGAYALMVTGEQAYSPVVQHVPNTSIMADAAASCLITLDGEGDVVRSFATRTLGEYAQWLELTPEQNTEFGEQYGGRIAEVIHRALEEAGLTSTRSTWSSRTTSTSWPGGRRSRSWGWSRRRSSWTTSPLQPHLRLRRLRQLHHPARRGPPGGRRPLPPRLRRPGRHLRRHGHHPPGGRRFPMSRQELILTIEKALGEVLERPVTGLTEETALFDELQLTSLAVLGLLMTVEEATGISVDPEALDIDHLRTVGSFADYVEAALRAEEGTP